MPYTKEDGGRLNNFAVEPKMYTAEPPSQAEKRNYVILSMLGALVIGGTIAIAVFASNVS
ncbi:MAG: ssl1498 family light-harvesting-like protein [Xenococcaceae cyanobacterium MO_188.B32]|nr:ssl1498 family light-harvesting-like protein [Xenococcaceae cyanobacterium MO_188.B32]